jgi:hypothetical protein
MLLRLVLRQVVPAAQLIFLQLLLPRLVLLGGDRWEGMDISRRLLGADISSMFIGSDFASG